MSIGMDPMGDGTAQMVHNRDGRDILELPVPEVQALFKSSGALIFRGFGANAHLMKAFADRFSSGFNRDRLRPPVEGTDGFVQMVTEGMGYVEPHSEQANSPFRPDAIWFCCGTPASEGGETLLWDGAALWERLGRELKKLFRAKKVRFFQRYSIERWKLFFGEGATFEDARRALDGVEGVSYYVAADQSIYLEYVCSAVVKTRYGHREAFANSLLSERQNTLGELMSFDDGSPITENVIHDIEAAMRDITEQIAWQRGDLAFIDNSRFLHGRNPFTDKQRQIFSSLSFLNFR